MDKKRVLSGIRATGRLHLGNYLGAIKGFLELQDNSEYECLYMVADLHTLTTPYDKESLKEMTRNVIMDYLAVGLNPNKSTLFVQSMIPAHSEMFYLFSTVVSLARVMHLPTYKDKLKQYPKDSTVALLNYPVLMAADILIYKAGLVPVGIDQEPHLEVAREVARKMNEKYGTDFPEPVRFVTNGEYVPSLIGEGKMSKSVEGSFINLSDDIEIIRKKVRSIPTSSTVGGEMTSGLKTLFKFFELFLPKLETKTIKANFDNGKLQYMQAKDRLAEAIYEELKPIQEKRKYFEKNPVEVDRIIEEGVVKARKIASETLREVKEKMGFI